VHLAGCTADRPRRGSPSRPNNKHGPWWRATRQFGSSFETEIRSSPTGLTGMEIIRRPFRTPQANGVAERFVPTVRSECLDWLLIFDQPHLERVLTVFADHYNTHRPHRALALNPPERRGHLSRQRPRLARLTSSVVIASVVSFTSTPGRPDEVSAPYRHRLGSDDSPRHDHVDRLGIGCRTVVQGSAPASAGCRGQRRAADRRGRRSTVVPRARLCLHAQEKCESGHSRRTSRSGSR
jgi:hypothetical protein